LTKAIIYDKYRGRSPGFPPRRSEGASAHLEGAAAGDGLVLVEGRREDPLAVEEVGHALLDGRHAGAAADKLDKVDLVLRHLSLVERHADRRLDALDEMLDHALEVLPT